VTIFERRSVSTNGIMLYSASSYHQSHPLHTEHTFIYAIRRERKEERKITRKGRDKRMNNHKREEIYGCRHTPTPKSDALLGVW
jgi:hypothetical protein